MSLFESTSIGSLTLKNKFIRAGCFEGMSQKGGVTPQLIEHHENLATGGIAMTTVAYCSISADGRVFDHEMWIREEILSDLKTLTSKVHAAGSKASIQLGHSGFFTSKGVIGKQPMGASPMYCLFTKSKCREMTQEDINEKVGFFVQAALMAIEAGFDAIEIHAGHGYLLSQFLSPWTNKRTDKYGGSLENRMRFTIEVIEALRKNIPVDFPILVKMNQADGMENGIQIEDAIEVAKALESAGANAIIPSAGFTSKVPFLMLRGNLPIKEMASNQAKWIDHIGLKLFGKFMVPKHDFTPLFLFEGAKKIAAAVKIPVIYIGGATSRDEFSEILNSGLSYIQIGRATIQDPDFVNKIESGELEKSPCDHCNRCVAEMDAGGVKCVSNIHGFVDLK
jgi:2,4-dienoyl-CoA reductase-like NADH-dependent reductase (Old Yellow Enzyme family)